MIFDGLERFADKTAIITATQQYTYRELLKMADSLSSAIKSRETVLLLLNNSVPSVAAYIGAIRKKAPVIILNAHAPIENISNIIERFMPNHVITAETGLEGYEKVFTMDNVNVWTLKKNSCSTPVHPELALLLTTSGSTGSPKFVRLSYQNLLANTASICEYLNIQYSDVGITCLPLYYSFGLSLLNTHFFAGASMVVTDESFLSPLFWKMIQEHHVSTFSGVPYSFSLLKRIGLHRFDLSSVRYVTQAGGKLPKEEVEYWCNYFKENGIDLVVMYGQTEATARMSYLPSASLKEHYGSIGVAIPGGYFSIMRNGEVITVPESEGELVYQGDNVSMGYAERKEDFALDDCNLGILHTGDLAYFDKDGYFYITGRMKRFVKLFGNRTNLDELERLLKREGVEALCAGRDDNLRIYLKDSSLRDKTDEIIKRNTLISPLAYKCIIIDCFPISESGKILYAKLPE
ncbi:AMP-binding protein [Bacteroides oleiciplenus]|uniref:AMP-binding protein n=1 Tax=Bacteroides oleiciplenus TaxID=626931 RepID=UPI0026DBB02F|nr:AMP-binding protein [Bacteroides oleiciplenus]